MFDHEWRGLVVHGFPGVEFSVWSLAVASAPRPRLAIAPGAGNNVLSWPVSFAGYALQASTTLAPPSWQNVAQAPVTYAGNHTVTVPVSSATEFYRLAYTNAAPSPPTVYLGTDQVSQQGLLKSPDGGATWLGAGLAGSTVNAIAVAPADPDTVYAGLANGFDAFLATFTPAGQLYYSSYAGGSGADNSAAIVLDGTDVFLASTTASPDFPSAATPNGALHPLDVVETPPVTNSRTSSPPSSNSGNPRAVPRTEPSISRAPMASPWNSFTRESYVDSVSVAGDPEGLRYHSVVGPMPQGNFDYITGTPGRTGTITFAIVYRRGECVWIVTVNVNVVDASP